MKYIFFSLLICAIAAPAALATDAVSPVGYWKSIDDETNDPKSIIQIEDRGGKLYGRIVKLFRSPDQNQNPVCGKCDGEKKDKPVIGMEIIWDLKKKGDEWSGGKIMDPNNGKTYKCHIKTLENGDKLEVRGYVGFSLLGRSQYWLRAQKPASEPKAPSGQRRKQQNP